MKILMLADSMHIGGAETHVFELSRLLVLFGHTVLVAARGGATAERLASVGVVHVPLPDAASAAVARSLADLIRREHPHVVHAHTRRRAFLCRILQKQLDFPLVFTAHAMFSPRFPLDRLSYFPPDVIAVSPDVAAHLTNRFSVPKSAITVIENGVDVHRFHPADPSAAANNGRPFTVLSVSRQDRDSAEVARLLCLIAPRLQARLGKPIRIVIAGGGNELPALRALAHRASAACGGEVVELLGAVADTAPLYRGCDVFVGVSRAAMEAMASEKPVILCGNEGYLGILDADTLPVAAASNLCARGQPAAEADRLLEDLLAVAVCSPEQRAALGAFGRKTVCRRYAAEGMAQKTLAVYQKAVNRFRKSRRTDAILCGYYGYGNCGDELILRHIVAEQKRRREDVRLGVMTASGTAPDGTLGIRRYHLPSVMRELRQSGALILGGGSLLQDATSRRSLLYYLSLIRAAHRMGRPVMLYANGLGPLSPRAEALCRKMFSLVDVISLRDADSWNLVREMNLPRTKVILGADPVLGEAHAVAADLAPLPRIALFPKGGAPRASQLALADGVAEVALAYGFDVALAAMNPHEDQTAVRRIAECLSHRLAETPRHVTVASSDPDAIVRLAGRSSLVMGERLHALILAFGAGVPAVGIERDPKIGAFMREIGKSRCVCREISPQSLFSSAKYALNSPHDRNLATKLVNRAHADADLAHRFILGEMDEF